MTTVAQVERDVSWLPTPNEVHLVLTTVLPPIDAISTSFALAFADDALLVTHLAARGWDIPGGHIEPGETPEAAMRREVYEETAARLGKAQLIGHQMIRVLAPMPPGYRYPYPVSYQVFYWAPVVELCPFDGDAEAIGRDFLAPEAAREMPFVRQNSGLYEAALVARKKSVDRG